MDLRRRPLLRPALLCMGFQLLFACAHLPGGHQAVPSAPPPSKGDLEDSRHAYVRCLFASADRLDDQTSDTHSVAEAIIPTCASQFDAMVSAHVAGYDDEAASLAAQKWDHARLSLAVSVVERERQLKKPAKAHHGHKTT